MREQERRRNKASRVTEGTFRMEIRIENGEYKRRVKERSDAMHQERMCEGLHLSLPQREKS